MVDTGDVDERISHVLNVRFDARDRRGYDFLRETGTGEVDELFRVGRESTKVLWIPPRRAISLIPRFGTERFFLSFGRSAKKGRIDEKVCFGLKILDGSKQLVSPVDGLKFRRPLCKTPSLGCPIQHDLIRDLRGCQLWLAEDGPRNVATNENEGVINASEGHFGRRVGPDLAVCLDTERAPISDDAKTVRNVRTVEVDDRKRFNRNSTFGHNHTPPTWTATPEKRGADTRRRGRRTRSHR